MIVLDSSALLAVALGEEKARVCMARMAAETQLVISAATFAEALIVAARRDVGRDMAELLESLACEIAPVNEATARRVGQAYARWGKGVHPAALNFGDCFAYVAAQERACPLLFVGDDFAKTDVKSALAV